MNIFNIFKKSSATFMGGIHPPEHKDATHNIPLERMPIPQRVVIPLSQHIGGTCEPLVAVGDDVREGQKIGEGKSFVSAPVHASISGKVTAIEEHPHPSFPSLVRSIVIENSGQASLSTWEKTVDWSALSSKEMLDKIKEAGIVGLGGAAFPSHVKLSPPKDVTLDTLIINGVECEPFLTVDHRIMIERGQDILEGVKMLRKLLNVKQVFIGIEKNKPDAISLFQQLTAGASDGAAIQVFPLTVKYPQGAEKQLIYSIVRREVPSGKLPFDVGVVVQNVGTALAMYEAVASNKPLIERAVTVGGHVNTPKNLIVRIGTPFSSVIDYAGGMAESKHPLKVLMGGPMMGIAQYTLEVPVVKGTSGILVMEQRHEKKSRPCVKCGECVQHCPMGLMPNRLADFSERDHFTECDEYNVRDCIECGVCTYICSSARPIVHLIKYAKLNLSKMKKP